MAGWRILSIVVACLVLFVVLEMMRRRKLREKYAGVWLVLAVGVVVLALVPQAADFLARITGVQTPSNFVFLLAGVVLALVALHLSTEVGHLEEEVRTSVEEIALLRCELADAQRELAERVTALEATVLDSTALDSTALDSTALDSKMASAPDDVKGLPEVSPARAR